MTVGVSNQQVSEVNIDSTKKTRGAVVVLLEIDLIEGVVRDSSTHSIISRGR